MLRRTVSGAFALTVAGFIAAATSPAHAESQAAHARSSTPYGSAAAIINANGSLNNGTNVRRSWRAGTGRYCVQLASSVDAAYSLIQLTPRDARRLPHIAYRNPSATCWRHSNTIAVNVYDTNTGRLANGGFDLLAL
ncbi:hypothetical protein SAMN05444920_11422 [Nonomuraea solani]|uniref:Peptidase inhibitor family I36 n=1 Tax=Nonomuraea solani TaxID=1144553 RepID=A0A1H6ERW3_9ACTN|nr:hypothetical protein [Nonomuraea solani]SEG99746.1 hypothetical protein SAMN05444920_11422 [Nonomuraea solani]